MKMIIKAYELDEHFAGLHFDSISLKDKMLHLVTTPAASAHVWHMKFHAMIFWSKSATWSWLTTPATSRYPLLDDKAWQLSYIIIHNHILINKWFYFGALLSFSGESVTFKPQLWKDISKHVCVDKWNEEKLTRQVLLFLWDALAYLSTR